MRLLIAVHDTLRNNQALRDLFAEYAERTGTIVIAPLFPAGISAAPDLDNYKYLESHGTRFDQVLLSMIDEVAASYGVGGTRFTLFGFSGGAHFAHRFLYVHPQRLEAVVAAAPGSVTLPTDAYDWWPGIRDFERHFGAPVDWPAMRGVPVHLLVGADDLDARAIVSSKDHPRWVEGADAAGTNRVERLHALHTTLRERGIEASLRILEGVAHSVEPIVKAAIAYLEARPPSLEATPKL